MKKSSENRAGFQGPELDPRTWLEDYGDHLFGYAYYRLRDAQVAEDLVQETLLSAWKARDRFEGRSSVKSWLTKILHNKLIDFVRKRKREQLVISQDDMSIERSDEFDECGGINHLYGARHWNVRPDQFSQQGDFWKVLRECLDNLPPKVAEVFMSREIDGLSTDEICEARQISANNLWVILHRARKGLRGCLEKNWFAADRPTEG